MIAPLAVSLALSFWAPFNHGQPVCPDGVKIHNVDYYWAAGSVPSTTFVRRENGALMPHCEMYADPIARDMSIDMQCAWVARNIGASFMGLPFTRDRKNIMYARGWVIPGRCDSPLNRP